ncbi:putative oxidoreductase [Paenibacillus polymyxa]|uniref:iron-containing alcohol dehydrogenase family protein n=1 Tax=Paenibacillus polymyxa TaxID=1406 RepID=UPI00279086F4|nr:iron-containing alcohol dehydrogenase family protein [Paenibacillus polymyxa]MDQ0049427.1 putative oxidoreductase [Paenibacillus polymyxa]
MESTVVLKAGPQEYYHSKGILNQLPQLISERKLNRLFVIHGERSLQAALPYLPSLENFEIQYEKYNGECSLNEIKRISAIARQNKAEGLMGIGGGKVADLVKAVAYQLQIPEILIPTLASNCAAFSAVSIIYNDKGVHVDSLSFPKATNLVLIEPEIILNSPVEYTVAGIGDTLAKWYEGVARLNQIQTKTIPMQLSFEMMHKCREFLFEFGEQSIKDAQTGKLTDAFINVIDTNIAVAGLVGGFGSIFAKSVGAHAFFNAATAIPGTNTILHGSLVAFGILVQLALEKKTDELKSILPFYIKIGLPTTLQDIHLDDSNTEALRLIAAKMTSETSRIHSLPFKVTADDALWAILTVNRITSSYSY